MNRTILITGTSSGLGRATAKRVRAALLEGLPSGLVTMEALARKLALSKRTLQHRIEAEDTSYQQVLQETRGARPPLPPKDAAARRGNLVFARVRGAQFVLPGLPRVDGYYPGKRTARSTSGPLIGGLCVWMSVIPAKKWALASPTINF